MRVSGSDSYALLFLVYTKQYVNIPVECLATVNNSILFIIFSGCRPEPVDIFSILLESLQLQVVRYVGSAILLCTGGESLNYKLGLIKL